MSIEVDWPPPVVTTRVTRTPLRDSSSTRPPVLPGAAQRLRVALVAEGTYPFTLGGVSTWCDQLVTTLPEVSFEVVSITATGGNEPVWSIPANVTGLAQLGFWEPAAPGEKARYVRAMGRGTVDEEAFGSVMVLLDELLAPTMDHERFGECLDRLIVHAERRELSPAFRCRDVVHALSEKLTVNGWNPSIADVTQCLDVLEHLLRPAGFVLPPVDVYHATGNGLAALVAMAGSSRTGAPIVLSEHGVYLRERYLEYLDRRLGPCTRRILLRFHRLLAAAAYERADIIVPVTSYNRRWEVHNGADAGRIRVVNNGVDPHRFALGDEDHSVGRAPTVGFLSRIDRIKDPLTLIRSAAILKEKLPEVRVRIWGSVAKGQDDYDRECRRAVSELGLVDTVSFEGATADPVAAYRQMDVLVSTSISEGLPYGIIEAMMCRKAIVSTNVGGLPEALEGVAILVEPRDTGALAGAITRVLSDPGGAEKLGRAAHARAVERFTLGDMIGRYRSIYDEAARVVDLRGRHPAMTAGGTGEEKWWVDPL